MAVRVLTAPPGMGKTLNLTRIAIELFKEENPFFQRLKKNHIYYNNIYSNYPILLWYKKKPFKYINGNNQICDSVPIKKVHDDDLECDYFTICKEEEREYYGCFSNYIRFTDMRLKYRFLKRANFFIDEIQYIYDSMEYSDFPDCIANFFQVHRHLNYNMIYTNSQSLSRVIKRVLCISEEFWNVIELKQYKLLPFLSICTFKITTDMRSGRNNENVVDDIRAKYQTVRFFNKRVYNGYITKYLGILNKDLPLYPTHTYNSLKMTKNEVIKGFMVTPKEKQELKDMFF